MGRTDRRSRSAWIPHAGGTKTLQFAFESFWHVDWSRPSDCLDGPGRAFLLKKFDNAADVTRSVGNLDLITFFGEDTVREFTISKIQDDFFDFLALAISGRTTADSVQHPPADKSGNTPLTFRSFFQPLDG